MIFIIKSASAFLREGPGSGSRQTDEVLHGMTVMAEAEEKDWLKVRTDYSYVGWLHISHVVPPIGFEAERLYISAHVADVLAAPKVQAPILTSLSLGCTVHRAAEGEGGWTQIILSDGSNGYVRSAFLRPFPMQFEIDRVCETAKLYEGAQYRWGGKSPLGIDCSGLCFMAYYLNGVSIYRDAKIMPGFPIKEIPLEEAKKGDLLFFPGHVGMLLEGDMMIHASEAGNGVKIEPISESISSRGRPTKAGSLSIAAS